VWPMFAPDNVTLLREVYNWTIADLNVNDLDDQKYTLCKKMSEVRTPVTPAPWIMTNKRSWPIAWVCSSSKSPDKSPMAAMSVVCSASYLTSCAIQVWSSRSLFSIAGPSS
jgi:hypothetical protein